MALLPEHSCNNNYFWTKVKSFPLSCHKLSFFDLVKENEEFQELLLCHENQFSKLANSYCTLLKVKKMASLQPELMAYISFLINKSDNIFNHLGLCICCEKIYFATTIQNLCLYFRSIQNVKRIFYHFEKKCIYIHCSKKVAWILFYNILENHLNKLATFYLGHSFYYCLITKLLIRNEIIFMEYSFNSLQEINNLFESNKIDLEKQREHTTFGLSISSKHLEIYKVSGNIMIISKGTLILLQENPEINAIVNEYLNNEYLNEVVTKNLRQISHLFKRIHLHSSNNVSSEVSCTLKRKSSEYFQNAKKVKCHDESKLFHTKLSNSSFKSTCKKISDSSKKCKILIESDKPNTLFIKKSMSEANQIQENTTLFIKPSTSLSDSSPKNDVPNFAANFTSTLPKSGFNWRSFPKITSSYDEQSKAKQKIGNNSENCSFQVNALKIAKTTLQPELTTEKGGVKIAYTCKTSFPENYNKNKFNEDITLRSINKSTSDQIAINQTEELKLNKRSDFVSGNKNLMQHLQGWKTASGKYVTVSDRAHQIAEKLYKDICSEDFQVNKPLRHSYKFSLPQNLAAKSGNDQNLFKSKSVYDVSQMELETVQELFESDSFDETDEECLYAQKLIEYEHFTKKLLESEVPIKPMSEQIPTCSTIEKKGNSIIKKELEVLDSRGNSRSLLHLNPKPSTSMNICETKEINDILLNPEISCPKIYQAQKQIGNVKGLYRKPFQPPVKKLK